MGGMKPLSKAMPLPSCYAVGYVFDVCTRFGNIRRGDRAVAPAVVAPYAAHSTALNALQTLSLESGEALILLAPSTICHFSNPKIR